MGKNIAYDPAAWAASIFLWFTTWSHRLVLRPVSDIYLSVCSCSLLYSVCQMMQSIDDAFEDALNDVVHHDDDDESSVDESCSCHNENDDGVVSSSFSKVPQLWLPEDLAMHKRKPPFPLVPMRWLPPQSESVKKEKLHRKAPFPLVPMCWLESPVTKSALEKAEDLIEKKETTKFKKTKKRKRHQKHKHTLKIDVTDPYYHPNWKNLTPKQKKAHRDSVKKKLENTVPSSSISQNKGKSSSSDRKHFEGKCFYCNKVGHKKKNCFKKMKDSKKKKIHTDDTVEKQNLMVKVPQLWLLNQRQLDMECEIHQHHLAFDSQNDKAHHDDITQIRQVHPESHEVGSDQKCHPREVHNDPSCVMSINFPAH